MNATKKQLIRSCLALGLVVLASHSTVAQIEYTWVNPDSGNWNDGDNWNEGVVPVSSFDETGRIANGGLAFVGGGVPNPEPTGGVTVAGGTLEIRNGGILRAQPDPFGGDATGAVTVESQTGEALLSVLGGGSLTPVTLNVMAGAQSSLLELSGSGNISVMNQATLAGTTRITGNAASFSVGSDLTIGGNFVSAITDPNTHTVINASGSVAINSGSTLTLEFGAGVTPSAGDSWTLASGTSVAGGFDNVVGPAIAPGVGYKVDTSGGNVSVEAANVLTLTVNRQTGAASISSQAGPVDVKLYAVGSPGGNLSPDTWVSFEDSGFDGGSWIAGSGNPFGLAEAHDNPPLGASTFAMGQSQSIGSVLNNQGLVFGESREDLTLTYLEPGSTVRTNGIVEYTGNHNNLVLVVDPDTGEAVIQNQSTFDAPIKLYSVASESGSLDHDPTETVGVGWDSFDETDVDGGAWLRGTGSSNLIVEANQVGSSTLISSGAIFDIGAPFMVGGEQDLTFEFLLDGASERMSGIVEYGELPPLVNADFDGNGLYQCADVDALVQAIVDVKTGGMPDLAFDLTGDGNVNDDDLVEWRTEAGAGTNAPPLTTSGNPVQEGDANLDGTVDVSDFNIWNGSKFTSTAAWCSGDFNADGSVDVSDFNLWNNNKFQTADGHVSSVPEPSTGMLLLSCLGLATCWRKRELF